MIRNSIVIMVVAAACATAASAASAAGFHTDGPSFLSGSSTTETSFTFDGGTVTCKETHYTGEQASTSAATLKLLPSTSGCSGFGGTSAEIDWNGCYPVHEVSIDLGPPIRLTSRVEIYCPSTPSGRDEVVITLVKLGLRACTIYIPTQTIESGGLYTNGEVGGVKNFTIDYSASTLQYSQVAGEALGCSNALNTKNGGMTGSVLVTGRNEKKEATSIWVE